MKKFFKEFREFISKGNVLDLAVGVIIGGAFSSVVKGLTDNIIQPLLNCIAVRRFRAKFAFSVRITILITVRSFPPLSTF